MLDVVLNDIPFNTLSGLTNFFVTFDVTIHFGLKTYKFSNRNAIGFVLNFPMTFLLALQ